MSEHDEIKALLEEIRDRLPEPEGAKDENTRFTNDLGTMTVSEDCGGDLNFHIHGNSGFASLNPHEVIRLLKVMQERADSYPSTLDRDRLPEPIDDATNARYEREDAEARQDEPVEPGDLRAGDKVEFTYKGERITGTCTFFEVGALDIKTLRSDAPNSGGYRPYIVFRGEWANLISDVRLIERAPLAGELDAAVWHRQFEKEKARAEKAEAERDEWKADLWGVLKAEQMRAEKLETDLARSETERDGWKAKCTAFRADVEYARRNPETLTRLLMRLADALDADDARNPTEGEKR